MNPDNHTWDLLVGALKGTLGEAEQRTFIRLLECEDPELFRWCMGHGVPEDPDFAAMIPLILERNQARHDSLR